MPRVTGFHWCNSALMEAPMSMHFPRRRLRTTQERRRACDRSEWDLFRPSRSWKRLINSYDDPHGVGQRSWKTHRLTQYRTR
jgi:hypothetical protein